jgi:hypothetical protein
MREEGSTLVEALVALTLTVLIVAGAAALFLQSGSAVQAQPEAIDIQQRLRVAVDALTKDLAMAGAGMYAGPHAGTLIRSIAPILPRKVGLSGADAPTVARADAITMLYVPDTYSQTTTAATLTPGAPLILSSVPNCPSGQPACGLQVGMAVIVFDETAHADLFSVTGVQPVSATVQPHALPFVYAYPPGADVAQVEARSYYLDPIAAQLRQYDGYLSDLPVADDIVGLTFEYFGDPRPPTQPKPPAGIENCLYDASGTPKPLARLTPGGDGLAPLPLAMLSDGPWCGGGLQFDADLLRIRTVRVTIRAQAAQAAFRSTSLAFARSGTSRASRQWLPDLAATLRVTPRNLQVTP